MNMRIPTNRAGFVSVGILGTLLALLVLVACGQATPVATTEPETNLTAEETAEQIAATTEIATRDEVVAIEEGEAHPTIALVVSEDPMAGWNVLVETTNFTFSPRNAGGHDVAGEGYGLIYVDGVQSGRLYTNWFHIASLTPGSHELRVALNGNSQAPYSYAGAPIEAAIAIQAPEVAVPEVYPMTEQPAGEQAYPMVGEAAESATGAYPMTEGHVHETDAAPHTHMSGEAIDIPEGSTHPTVKLKVFRDPTAGWNFQVETENFVFSPQNASRPDVLGEGHAHIYVDGVKLGRLYGEWFYIRDLPAGSHEIRVSLNGNSHAPYYYAGLPVETSVTLEVGN